MNLDSHLYGIRPPGGNFLYGIQGAVYTVDRVIIALDDAD
jgi:hypothetical protein